MRNLPFLGALLVVLAIMALGLVAMARIGGGPPPDARLSLKDLSPEQEQPSPQNDFGVLRFAVAAVLSPRQTLESYEALRLYLERRLDRPVELVQNKTYAETNALVRSGDVALALVCSGAYVVGRREFGMQALVVPVVRGEMTYRSLLIVPAASGVQGWQDLRGKTFAFTDPLSNSGRLVPVYVLSELGETPEKFFKNFFFTYAHDRSILAVADGLVDGAAVDSLVYDWVVRDHPDIGAKTRVVWSSQGFGINPLVVNPKIDPVLRRQIEALLVGMSADPDGQKILSQLGIDSFTEPSMGAYDGIEAMLIETAGR